MGWGSLSKETAIRILLELRGGAAYRAELDKSAASTLKYGYAVESVGKKSEVAARRSWLFNQAMYTSRRYAFYGTLAVTALAAGVLKLGYNYYATMQTASIAFKGILGSQQAVHNELRKIYILAAESPFQFPDLVIGTRRLLPFTKNLKLTNDLIAATTNGLSGMGMISSSSMQRATLMLSHMFTVGRLTGQILYNLGRDNLPMMQALEKHFHTTGATIRQMVAGGLIDANTAAHAFINFINTSPQFAGQARLQATKTLPGAISTLKDLVGMSGATSNAGLFEGIRKSIQGVDFALIDIAKNNKNITFTDLVRAIDQQLTPSTHALLNTFVMLNYALKTVVTEFGIMYKILWRFFWPISKVTGLFGASTIVAKGLGIVLGTLITLWTVSKIKLEILAIQEGINTLVQEGWLASLWGTTAALIRNIFFTEVATTTTGFYNQTVITGYVWMFKWPTVLARMSAGLGTVTGFLWGAGVATWDWFAALTAIQAMSLVGFILLAATFVTLYITSSKFRAEVNHVFKSIMDGAGPIAFALRTAFQPIYQAYVVIRELISAWQWWQAHGQHAARNTLITSPTGDLGGISPNRGNSSTPHHHRSIWSWLAGYNGLASGGITTSAGGVVVGERGAEVLNLPRAATVTPLPDAVNMMGGQKLAIYIYPQPIMLDGKQIAESTATAVTDREARK